MSDWFEEEANKECSRILYGQCHTHACLKRGGYIRGQTNIDPKISTCFHYEAMKRLKLLPPPDGDVTFEEMIKLVKECWFMASGLYMPPEKIELWKEGWINLSPEAQRKTYSNMVLDMEELRKMGAHGPE